jgi:hypothetical protein
MAEGYLMRTLILRLLGVFSRWNSDDRLSEEIQAHLDLLTEEHVRRGLSLEEARFEARRAFGGIERTKEAYRDRRGLPLVDDLVRDVQFGVRLLQKDRRFTFVAMMALALGLGANNMFFAIVNAYCLRGLPIDRPDRVVYLSMRDAQDRDWQVVVCRCSGPSTQRQEPGWNCRLYGRPGRDRRRSTRARTCARRAHFGRCIWLDR